jgi:hypothetical protein
VNHAAEFRRCLEQLDVVAARRIWAEAQPHLPQPKTDAEAEMVLHYARTQSDSMQLKLRAWSHRWLLERGLPSGLPDRLRPSAERIYPRVVSAVGIALGATSELARAVRPHVMGAMQDAVRECYADGHQGDHALVRARILEAKASATRKLLGRAGLA